MNRFIRFVVANLCVLGLVGWLQWSQFDPDGFRSGFGSWGGRSGVRMHKRVAPRRRRSPTHPFEPDRESAVHCQEDPPWNGSSPTR